MSIYLLLLLPGLLIVLQATYLWIKGYFTEGNISILIPAPVLVNRWGSLLQEKNPFYASLSRKGKLKFVGRVRAFVNTVHFTPKGELMMTEDKRVLIGACATQLTWGFRQYLIDGFDEFYLYPGIFVNSRTGHEYYGATFDSGKVILSWEDFEKGYANPNDGRNLGLHEMAHALKLNAHQDKSHHGLFMHHFSQWSRAGISEMERMKRSGDHFLREYAERNLDEFFAVSVEYFFEQPAEFRQKLPEVYYQLCVMLRIDPENTAGDYTITREKMEDIYAVLYQAPLTWFNIRVRKTLDTMEDLTDYPYRLLWPAIPIILLYLISHC